MKDVSKHKVGAVVASILIFQELVIPYKIFLQVLWLHKISWDNTAN